MRAIRMGLLALLLPVVARSQAAPPKAPPPPSPPAHRAPPSYRGFTPGLSYRAFVDRANALADHDVLACRTSPRTAQLMECGVVIRDPADGARDRKSTRLNSSHGYISYAVFCLKRKTSR